MFVNPVSLCYKPACHIITGDLNIVHNDEFRDVIFEGPYYWEPGSLPWKLSSKLIFDSFEEYA